MKKGVRAIVLTEEMKRKIRLIEVQREDNVISQTEAATLMGVSVPTYRKWRRQVVKEALERN